MISATMPIKKINAVAKMKINARSTPSAKLDAPENIVVIVWELSEIIINKSNHNDYREQEEYPSNHQTENKILKFEVHKIG